MKLEDGKQHIFTANSSLTVEVGAPVEIWTVDTNGYKTILLSADDGTTGPVVSAPFKLNMKNMPDADVTVTARFELKRYPVYFQANTGGRVVVNKAFGGVMEGVVQQSGDKVKHFTELTIEAEPLNESYRLKKEGLKVSMGGVAVSNLKYIASVTGEVDIKADFEKVYEVRLLQPQYGSLAVLSLPAASPASCDGSNCSKYYTISPRHPNATRWQARRSPTRSCRTTRAESAKWKKP